MEAAESGSDNESSVEPSLAMLEPPKQVPSTLPTLEQKLAPPPSERLILNVGGRRYETFVATVCKYPDTLLGIMFRDRNSSLRAAQSSSGEFFFDRNQEAFGAILDWYRTNLLFVPATVPLQAMLLELDFWQIPLTRDDIAHDASLGQRLQMLSIAKAERAVERTLQKLWMLCVNAATAAAEEGCTVCKIDFLKGHSYLRASAGKDKTTPTKYHVNVVDKAMVQFFRADSNTYLLTRRLKQEGFAFTFASIGQSSKNYCLTINLWQQSAP